MKVQMKEGMAEAIKGLKQSTGVSGRAAVKHSRLFNIRKLGNRHLLGVAVMVEPMGMEVASGHYLCNQKQLRWCFMQDVQSETRFGRGTELINSEHYIKVLFDRDGTKSQRELNIATKLDWRMTATAVTCQSRWSDAIGQLPSDITPLSPDDFRTPELMNTSLICETDAKYKELMEHLVAQDRRSLYLAYRKGRSYRVHYDGVVNITRTEEGLVEIQIDAVENTVEKPLVYSVLESISEIHVEHGASVSAGDLVFTLFPRSEFKPEGRIANHDIIAQSKELDEAFGVEAIDAMNWVHMNNETFRYDPSGRIAVPYRILQSLDQRTLEQFAPNGFIDYESHMRYDMTPVANCADDDTHAYLLVPYRAAGVRGRRWMSDIRLDVEVKLG